MTLSETVSLPVDHPDVRRYGRTTTAETNSDSTPAHRGPVQETISEVGPGGATSGLSGSTTMTTASPDPCSLLSSNMNVTTTTAAPASSSSTTTTTTATARPLPPKRRKPRQSLESMNAELVHQASIKKMSTFEKVRPGSPLCPRNSYPVRLIAYPHPSRRRIGGKQSQMDWNSLTSTSDSLSTELEANRRTGGFLEKQDFLGRVGERKDMRGQGELGPRRRVG